MSGTAADSVPPVARKRRPFYRDLSFQVLAGLILGICFGLAYPKLGIDMKPFGDAFIRIIQMVIGPVIFCTVVHGIAEVGDLKKVGRIAFKALVYFEVITTLALIIAMILMNVFHPGTGMDIDPKKLNADSVKDIVGGISKVESASAFLLQIIPKSIFDAFARGDILQILFFSILFGGGLTVMGEKAAPVTEVINTVTKALFWIIAVAMKLAPLAAFGAMAYTVGQFGVGTLISLLKLVVIFWVVCTAFLVLVLWPVTIWAGFSFWKTLRYIASELLLVAGTSSQETVFPQLTQKLRRLGCNETVVGLVLPTSYTFNHDGTCIYVACLSLFLAQATNTPMDWQHQLVLLAMLLLTTKGAAGVAGAALVVLAASIQAYGNGLPVAAVALVVGVHRFLSPAFVGTNVIGNTIATLVVASWENGLDRKKLKAELDMGYVPEPAREAV